MAERFVRLPELMNVVGLRRSSIYSRVRTGQFPAPKKITKHAVGWLESEINAWIEQRCLGGLVDPYSPPRIRVRHRVHPGAKGGAQ